MFVKKTSIRLEPDQYNPIGRFCIVRCKDAGVWAGTVAAKKGRDAVLTDARRLWTWSAVKGHTLSAVANYGIKGGLIPASVAEGYLTETCEFIPASTAAKVSIMEWPEHVNECLDSGDGYSSSCGGGDGGGSRNGSGSDHRMRQNRTKKQTKKAKKHEQNHSRTLQRHAAS